MKSGFVGLLDVLGFSALVAGDGAERLRVYLNTLQQALSEQASLEYVVFSDTIVLTTQGDSDDAALSIFRGCSRAFGLLLDREIPIRGAVAYGPYSRIATGAGVFIAGKAVLEAHAFEVAQDWVGIMLTPSALRRLPDLTTRCALPGNSSDLAQDEVRAALQLRMPWPAFLQPGHIPFQRESEHQLESHDFEGFAIVPTDGSSTYGALRDSLNKSLASLKWLKSLAPDPRSQQKYESAHRWLNPIQSHWYNAAYWQQRRDDEAASRTDPPTPASR